MQHFSIEIEQPLEERMPQRQRSTCHHKLGLALLAGAVATCVYFVAAQRGTADAFQEMGDTPINPDDIKPTDGPEKQPGFLSPGELVKRGEPVKPDVEPVDAKLLVVPKEPEAPKEDPEAPKEEPEEEPEEVPKEVLETLRKQMEALKEEPKEPKEEPEAPKEDPEAPKEADFEEATKGQKRVDPEAPKEPGAPKEEEQQVEEGEKLEVPPMPEVVPMPNEQHKFEVKTVGKGETCSPSTNPPTLCADDLVCYTGAAEDVVGGSGACMTKEKAEKARAEKKKKAKREEALRKVMEKGPVQEPAKGTE